jgi:23S rRNA pseudouridine1911/1915/1917 synthase
VCVCVCVSTTYATETPLNGVTAKTVCTPIQRAESQRFGKLTLVELSPLTGRRHQLRKHMNFIGSLLV